MQIPDMEQAHKETSESMSNLVGQMRREQEAMKAKLTELKELDIVPKTEFTGEQTTDLLEAINKLNSPDEMRKLKFLGQGAFGTVELRDIPMEGADGPRYAVKMIEKALIVKQLQGDEGRYIQMRDRELLVSKLAYDIKYCLKFYKHWEQDGKEYFVYEECKGGDMTSRKHKLRNKRFTEVMLKRYLEQIAHAIGEMHKLRIVHRDIKPDNILLTDETD